MSDKHPSWHPKKKKESGNNNGSNNSGKKKSSSLPELPYDRKVKR